MAQQNWLPTDHMDENHARETLNVYYGMLLGCTTGDLHRPGWLLLPPRMEFDPMALLFGQRSLVHLVAPVAAPPSDAPPTASGIASVGAASVAASVRVGSAGVAVIEPQLRAPLSAFLRDLTPAGLFSPAGVAALDAIVRREEPDCFTEPDEAHLHIRYVTPQSFRPYIGQWQEFIEPLDEGSESEPLALGLLARYSGGVYVIRQRRSIASFAGVSPQSPHVAEIGVRTDITSLRGHGLARAVVSRATRAVFASDRLPLYRHRASNLASQHIADALGYRLYGQAITYFAPPR